MRQKDEICALSPTREEALRRLAEAHRAALDTGANVWEFSCQLSSLHAQGVTETSLRWLVAEGFAEHRSETTLPQDKQRRFTPVANTRFSNSSCFVLTTAGRRLVERLKRSAPARPKADVSHERGPTLAPADVPHYDPDRRMLFFSGVVVKRFQLPAQNQELILQAFQEESWPFRIDDPLPPLHEVEPKKRLHDAIYRLNANQKNRLILFHGDGTSRGVFWQATTERR